MTLPISQRKPEVFSKLEYAEYCRNNLMNELFSAKNNNIDYKFISHTSAEILSVTREAFDYLGKDIVDHYLLPNTTKKNILNKKDGIYFPFHVPQVKELHSPLHELKVINSRLYADLLNFVECIANKETIPNTLFNYRLFLDIKDMVNDKKHDRLIAIDTELGQEIIASGEHLSFVIPKKKQSGWDTLTLDSTMTIKEASEYRFAYNNVEVGDCCLFAVKATELIIHKFYSSYFA